VQNGAHANAWEAIAYSWSKEGPLGLFAGGKLKSQIFRDVPYAIITLVSYELLQYTVTKAIRKHLEHEQQQLEASRTKKTKHSHSVDDNTAAKKGVKLMLGKFFSDGNNKKLRDALCGSVAGGLGSFATTPMDVVKTRMMTGTQYASVADAALRIAREEGLLTFFVGAGPRLMHKIPANGLFFLTYEAFRTLLGVAATGSEAAPSSG
jgi:Mitochondrial carrier protein